MGVRNYLLISLLIGPFQSNAIAWSAARKFSATIRLRLPAGIKRGHPLQEQRWCRWNMCLPPAKMNTPSPHSRACGRLFYYRLCHIKKPENEDRWMPLQGRRSEKERPETKGTATKWRTPYAGWQLLEVTWSGPVLRKCIGPKDVRGWGRFLHINHFHYGPNFPLY